MRPRKLKIMGLNSFTDEQTIDFKKLTEKGLFGIFGPTGSGKSTILDAITIAMYGKISRGTSEFINTEKGELHVSYEFEIGPKSNRKVYIIERHMKRDPNTGSYKTGSSVLREIEGSAVNVLCDKTRDVDSKIIEIVGLNCDDFTRSVVLPQGKFSEFLRLKNQDRRNMLERIFRLEKFGSKMTEKIRKVKREKEKEFSSIEGALQRYEGISQEAYSKKNEQIKILLEEEKKLRKEKDRLAAEFEKYKKIWELQEELESYTRRANELELKKQDMNDKKERLTRAKSALTVKPFCESVEETGSKIQKCLTEIENLQERLNETEKRLNEIETEYKRAYELKEKELPLLIQKEANLKQALEIDKKIKELMAERESLVSQYREMDKKVRDAQKELDKVLEMRKSAASSIDSCENRINEIKIEPEYREKVIKGAEAEKEYIELKSTSEEKNKKILALKSRIDSMRAEYNEVVALRDEKVSLISGIEEKKSTIEGSCPGDNKLLLQKQEALQDMERAYDEARVNLDKKAELEGILSDLYKRRDILKDSIASIESESAEKKNCFDELCSTIRDMERMSMAEKLAAQIKEGEPCPVCGSVHHPAPARSMDSSELDNKNELKDALKQEIDELDRNLNSLKIELAGISKEIEMKEAELKAADERLSNVDIASMEGMKHNLKNEFEELKAAVARWEKDKIEVESSLSKEKNEKSLIDSKEARLSEGIKKDQESLDTLIGELSEINKKLQNASTKYKSYKEDIKAESLQAQLDNINNRAREEDRLRNDMNKLRAQVEQYDRKKEGLESSIKALEIERTKIEESGRQKKSEIENWKSKRNELSEGRDPESYITEVRSRMDAIKTSEADLKEKLENAKDEKQKYSEKKASEEKNLITLKGVYSEQHDKLIKALDENGFEDSSEAMGCLMAKMQMDALEKELKVYDETVRAILNNISTVKEKLGSENIDEDKWRSVNDEKKQNEETLEQHTRIIAAEQKVLENMAKDLEEVKKLNAEKKSLEHNLDLLEQLDKLVQGNRFVEFASLNQLRYISIEASKRLREITGGRYALELNSEGEFVMRDDFNGGARRAVDTLSGGETFLTSLCLAIALSSHIQLKGSAPLEFFFLDEGFGTLDSELLETVMSSLEKLQSDRLSVGIISHVEELKNRVPVKLLVTPARPGAGGTKVSIEYS